MRRRQRRRPLHRTTSWVGALSLATASACVASTEADATVDGADALGWAAPGATDAAAASDAPAPVESEPQPTPWRRDASAADFVADASGRHVPVFEEVGEARLEQTRDAPLRPDDGGEPEPQPWRPR